MLYSSTSFLDLFHYKYGITGCYHIKDEGENCAIYDKNHFVLSF